MTGMLTGMSAPPERRQAPAQHHRTHDHVIHRLLRFRNQPYNSKQPIHEHRT